MPNNITTDDDIVLIYTKHNSTIDATNNDSEKNGVIIVLNLYCLYGNNNVTLPPVINCINILHTAPKENKDNSILLIA